MLEIRRRQLPCEFPQQSESQESIEVQVPSSEACARPRQVSRATQWPALGSGGPYRRISGGWNVQGSALKLDLCGYNPCLSTSTSKSHTLQAHWHNRFQHVHKTHILVTLCTQAVNELLPIRHHSSLNFLFVRKDLAYHSYSLIRPSSFMTRTSFITPNKIRRLRTGT